MSDDIVGELKDFLRRHIKSVGHLEILVLFSKDLDRSWTAQQISQELRTNLSLAGTQLDDLTRSGIVEICEDGSSRCVMEPVYRETLKRLVSFYLLRRSLIIEFIYSQPLDRIRSFADAFRIKKD